MIYLASKSPRRKSLLKEAGFAYQIRQSRYIERAIPRATPEDHALIHAVGKAHGAKLPARGVILAADTLIEFKGQVVGKPKSRAQAKQFLIKFSGKTHTVITGVCLKSGRRCKTFCVKSKVRFRELSDALIEAYLKTGEYRDKAGAYGYQGYGNALVQKVTGSRTNVIGLPMERLKRELRNFPR
jgi:septum formation protein